MSKLETRKRRAKFETSSTVMSRGQRNIVIELYPTHMEFRPKGARIRYALNYETCFDLAVKKAMLASRLVRMNARRAGKKKVTV